MIEGKTVVLVLTCKKFEPVWDPFFILFRKYWPDCPYELIMGTDVGSYSSVKTISLGTDFGWSNNCIQIISTLVDYKLKNYILTFFLLHYSSVINHIVQY